MNALGEQGWELAGTNVVNGSQVSFVFKRPKHSSETKYSGSLNQAYGQGNTGYFPEKREWVREQKPSSAPDYRAFHLQRASAGDVAEVLKSTFSLKNVVTDAQTNSLHVQSEPKTMKEVEQFIKKLDAAKASSDPK